MLVTTFKEFLMMRAISFLLACLCCTNSIEGVRDREDQMLAMHLLMANPARAHSSALRRSSMMVMQASSSKTLLQALLGQLTSHVLLDNPAFVSSTVGRENMVGDLYSLEASAVQSLLSNKEKTKQFVKEKLLADRERAAAQTGPKMKAKHAARAGSADPKMTFIKDSYPFSEAGYICKKRDEMREYWTTQGMYLPNSLKELLKPSFSDILTEDGLLKEADADEEELRKVCDEHLEKWALIDQSKFTEADLNWADIAEGKVKEEPKAVKKEAEEEPTEEPKKPKKEAKKAKKPKK